MSETLQFNVQGFAQGRPAAKFGRGSLATYKNQSVRVVDRHWTGSSYLYEITTPENLDEDPTRVVIGVREEDLRSLGGEDESANSSA